MDLTWLFPYILFLHVLGAIAAFGPTFAFPIIGAMGGKEPQHANFATRVSATISDRLVIPLAILQGVTGVLLIWISGRDLLDPGSRWLVLAIVLYVIAIGFSLSIQKRHVERIIELTSTPPPPGRQGSAARPDRRKSPRSVAAWMLAERSSIVAIVFLMVAQAVARRLAGADPGGTAVPWTPGTSDRRQETPRPMPHVATSTADLLETIRPAAHLDGDRLVIDDEAAFRATAIRDLAWTAAFSDDEATTSAAQWLVWEASQELGAHSASIQELYMARGRGEVGGFTVPAINLRAQTFDMARTIFETADERSTSARSSSRSPAASRPTRSSGPIDFVDERPRRGIAAGWRGPVFLQGDHYQFNAKKYAADPEAMTEEIRRACRLAVEAGYRQHRHRLARRWSTSRKPTVDEQQRENYVRAAELTALIRELETDGVTVSVGGEIGEVGQQNSTVEELRAYLDGYRRELDARAAPGAVGVSKVSVQTGTSHGGVPLPGGGVAEVKLDFEVAPRARRGRPLVRPGGRRPARRLDAARRAVPPLPGGRDGGDPPRDRASRTRCTSTRPSRESLHREIEAWCHANAADERKPDQTDAAVRLHDAQEGDRPVQAPALGPRDQGRDPRRPAAQDRASCSRSSASTARAT